MYTYICSPPDDLPFPAFQLFHFSYFSALLPFPACQLPVWQDLRRWYKKSIKNLKV